MIKQMTRVNKRLSLTVLYCQQRLSILVSHIWIGIQQPHSSQSLQLFLTSHFLFRLKRNGQLFPPSIQDIKWGVCFTSFPFSYKNIFRKIWFVFMISYRKMRSDTVHNIKSYGTVEVGIHAYLTFILDLLHGQLQAPTVSNMLYIQQNVTCGHTWFRHSVEEKNLLSLPAIQWFLSSPACGLEYLVNDFLFIVKFLSFLKVCVTDNVFQSCITFSHVDGYLDDKPE